MNDLKLKDKAAAFQNATPPDWYLQNGEPTTRAGINSGLMVYLDAHTDLLEALSIDSDIGGFNALISPRTDFPLTFQRGFEVKAGHKNLIALTATKIDADDSIAKIEPERRNCRFDYEAEQLKLHKNYSQANCFLECALFYAQAKLQERNNSSHVCTPWFFPFTDSGHVMCDPWESAQLVRIMEHDIPTDQCNYCLPDCSRTIYYYTASSQPFRKCDEKNFGVSELCNLEMTNSLPQPQIFGTQVVQVLEVDTGAKVFYIKLSTKCYVITGFSLVTFTTLILAANRSQ
jgi:hypothetical protein